MGSVAKPHHHAACRDGACSISTPSDKNDVEESAAMMRQSREPSDNDAALHVFGRGSAPGQNLDTR
jgi:hypothetical protein